MKLPSFCWQDARLRRLRPYLSLLGVIVLAGLLAVVAGTAGGASQPKRVAFLVTLQATVTKNWNAVTKKTEAGCPTTRRSVGHRTVTLRSSRPTTVVVTFGKGRVSYAPAVVRFVSGELTRSGSQTTSIGAPCVERTKQGSCTRRRRSLRGLSFRFFRSARDEVSFRPARLPEFAKRCPPESSEVLAIRPGLAEAQGELSEVALANPRIPNQTATASSEVTTDLEAEESGSVVERVHWELTFTRKR